MGADNGSNESSSACSAQVDLLNDDLLSKIALFASIPLIGRKPWPHFFLFSVFPLNGVIATATTADPDALTPVLFAHRSYYVYLGEN
jgi:hypothetical protein